MKVVAIIQARMGSTRLPGKVLKEVLGKPLLEYQLERVRRSSLIDEIVIATTLEESEQPIIDFCLKHQVSVYRGSVEDVLSRYYETAKMYKADVVVRITSDCPLLDPEVVDQVIRYYLDHYPRFDYVSNTLDRTYPRGMDIEVFSFQALNESFHKAVDPSYREHVTPYIYKAPGKFSLGYIKNSENFSDYRWTVDTIEDYELIKTIIDQIYPTNKDFSMNDVIELINFNPNLKLINAHIEQKKE